MQEQTDSKEPDRFVSGRSFDVDLGCCWLNHFLGLDFIYPTFLGRQLFDGLGHHRKRIVVSAM
jgi:hypothetical protein